MRWLILLISIFFTLNGFTQTQSFSLRGPEDDKFFFIEEQRLSERPHEYQLLPDLRLYPNPVGDDLYYQFSHDFQQRIVLTVHNSLGQVQYSRVVSRTTGSIDMSWMQPGVYIVRISDGRRARSYKVSKQ